MPKIQQVNTIDITPERFVKACDSTELHELQLLTNRALDRLEEEISLDDSIITPYTKIGEMAAVKGGSDE